MVTIHHNVLTPSQCMDICAGTLRLLEPRGDNRSDHYPMTLDTYPITPEIADIITSLLHGLHGHHLKVLRYLPGHSHPTHVDYFGNHTPSRSLSIQLSDPTTYSGGILHIDGAPMPIIQATAITFPSTTPHGVTRLTRGERWSLTAWAYQ